MSSTTGHIALFDLSAKLRLLHLVRAAHDGAVAGLEWIQGQPMMMTSGGDNSLKVSFLVTPLAVLEPLLTLSLPTTAMAV